MANILRGFIGTPLNVLLSNGIVLPVANLLDVKQNVAIFKVGAVTVHISIDHIIGFF